MFELFENILTYISTNTKDFVNICFWLFTGVIAFFTYKNAKKTLFNPIRSEMVKYQMKVITDFIDKHTSKGYDFDTSIDYSNLLKLNFETDYLFDILTNESKFGNHPFNEIDTDRLNFCKENLGGLFEIRLDNKKLDLEAVYGDFDTAKQYIQTKSVKEKEALYKHLFLQRFYLTKRFFDFYIDLTNLQTNPFIPEVLKNEIDKVVENIYFNIGELFKLLTTHISEQKETNYQAVYSQFMLAKIDHKSDLKKLRTTISTYFKVNQT